MMLRMSLFVVSIRASIALALIWNAGSRKEAGLALTRLVRELKNEEAADRERHRRRRERAALRAADPRGGGGGGDAPRGRAGSLMEPEHNSAVCTKR